MCIGGSSYDWYGNGAGGVAYVGVTYYPGCWWCRYYWPAFVFPDELGGGWPKYVWEAVSHELGHNMGLWHDGTATQGYYTGASAAGSDRRGILASGPACLTGLLAGLQSM